MDLDSLDRERNQEQPILPQESTLIPPEVAVVQVQQEGILASAVQEIPVI
jgi:hypothetical protein